MATIPDPSDGGTWAYEEDYENASISNGTDLATHNSDFNNTGTANGLLYNTTNSRFEAQSAGTGANYLYEGLAGSPVDIEAVALLDGDWIDDYLLIAMRRIGAGTGYFVLYDDPDEWELFDSADGVALDTDPSDPVATERWWVRIRCVGTTIQGRVWEEGTSEPGTWMEATDSSSTTGDPAIIVSSIGADATQNLIAYAVKEAETGTNADAGTAASTGTSNNASTTVAPTPLLSAATGTANNAVGNIAASAATATATGTANNPIVDVAPNAATAAATGTTNNPSASIAASSATATAAGDGVTPAASIAPNAAVAEATGTSNDATASTAGGPNASAGTATATGTANNPAANVAPATGVGACTAAGHDATITAVNADSGNGWNDLLAIIHEAAQTYADELAQPPTVCPNDGTVLETNPYGELRCPFDGWEPRNRSRLGPLLPQTTPEDELPVYEIGWGPL